MKNLEYAIPKQITAEDIKRVRGMFKMSQNDFAHIIGCSKPTIERWESGKEFVSGPAAVLIFMIEQNPDFIYKMIIPKKEYPLSLYYMYKQMICTIIDVDVLEQKVKIINYTDKLMFRAFGSNLNPTFDDYNEFLKSRCFPETRDKIKVVLADLDLPFYDPFIIIQKTEGRMAEDNFWIKIED